MKAWKRTHRSLRPGTTCTGTYRLVADDGRRPAEAECDGCGDQIGVPQASLTGPLEPTEQLEPAHAGSAEALGW